MRGIWQALTIAMLLVIAATLQAGAQNTKIETLKKQAEEFFNAGRYADAVTVSEQMVEAAERDGVPPRGKSLMRPHRHWTLSSGMRFLRNSRRKRWRPPSGL